MLLSQCHLSHQITVQFKTPQWFLNIVTSIYLYPCLFSYLLLAPYQILVHWSSFNSSGATKCPCLRAKHQLSSLPNYLVPDLFVAGSLLLFRSQFKYLLWVPYPGDPLGERAAWSFAISLVTPSSLTFLFICFYLFLQPFNLAYFPPLI